MIFLIIFFLALLGGSSAFLDGDDSQPQIAWHDLKVTWGPNLADPTSFVSMPRTASDAKDQGFEKISDCDENGKWRGARYTKDNDTFLVLLYDVNGYIAGIQTMFPADKGQTGYPGKEIQPPLIRDGDHYVLTAYFTNPEKICSSGRSMEEFKLQGTGVNLYVQNGPDAEKDSMLIPYKQSDTKDTKWTKGNCVPTMGRHYWYDTSDGMDCNNFFPVFPLYNGGKITGLGWAILGTKVSSKHVDKHVTKLATTKREADPLLMCLANFPHPTFMHMYMTSDISKNWC